VCVCVRDVGRAVAFLRTGANVTAWQWHTAVALGSHTLWVGHLGRAHGWRSAADGRTRCFPPRSSPTLVCYIMFITLHNVYG